MNGILFIISSFIMASNYVDDLVIAYLQLIILRNRDNDAIVQMIRYYQDNPNKLYKLYNQSRL